MFNISLSLHPILPLSPHSLERIPMICTCLTLLNWRSFIYSLRFESILLCECRKTSIAGLSRSLWLCSNTTLFTTQVPSSFSFKPMHALQPVFLLALSRCRAPAATFVSCLPSRTHRRYRLYLLFWFFLIPKPVCLAYVL